MTSVSEDRQQSFSPGLAIKQPVRAASTGNLAALSGLLLIDGVQLIEKDRVLVKNQNDKVLNGIYSASSGSWTRTPDFDGIHDVANGTIVLVREGGQASQFYQVTTPDVVEPGVDQLTFILSLTASMSSLSFLAAGAGAVPRSAQNKMRDIVSVKDYGAAGDGVTDDTAAFALAALVGGKIYIPKGNYVISDTVLFAQQRTNVYGDGQNSSIISFHPAAPNKVCFHFKFAAASAIAQSSIKDLQFDAFGNAQNGKVALRITDGEEIDICDVAVSQWTSAAFDCIGFQFRGRQTHDIRDVTVFADKPVSIETNPNNGISCDHYHFWNCYYNANQNPIITIADGVNLTQLTMDGYQAWTGGTSGILWIDTTTVQVANGFVVKNVRTEQTQDATKYFINIQHNTGLQGLVVESCAVGDRRGYFFRKVQFWHIKDSYFSPVAIEALNIDNTVILGRGTNNFWQQTATATIGGGVNLMWQGGILASAALASDFLYEAGGYNPAEYGFHGTFNNNNAPAGFVGEVMTATVNQAGALALTSPNALTVTSIILTPGDWDVWGTVDYLAGGATTFTVMKQGISTVNNTIGAQDTFTNLALAGTLAAASDMAQNTPHVRISIFANTTVYLVAQATFAVSTLKAYGTIFARRRR